MASMRLVFASLLTFALGLGACGDSSTDPESACADCPESVVDICERGVQDCIDIGGSLVDECINAIVRACQGE
jgi:hypothetical protein